MSPCNVKAVCLALRAYMDGPSRPDPGANAFPGVEQLAEELELHPRTVSAALAVAVDRGYLLRTDRGRAGTRATFAAALPHDDPAEAQPASRRTLSLRRDAPSACVGTHPTSAVPPQEPTPPHRARERPVRPPLVAALPGGGGDYVEGHPSPQLRALAAALPAPLAADLLADPRARRIGRRLGAVSDVMPMPELIEVLTAKLPRAEEVASIAGLLLQPPRLPRLEARATARRVAANERAAREQQAAAAAAAARQADEDQARGAQRDLAAIAALPHEERDALYGEARRHPLLRHGPPCGDDHPLLRGELLNVFRRRRGA